MLLGSGAQKKKRKTKKLKFNCVSVPCKKGRPQTKELKLNFVKSTRKGISFLFPPKLHVFRLKLQFCSTFYFTPDLVQNIVFKINTKSTIYFFKCAKSEPHSFVQCCGSGSDKYCILYMYSIVSQENFAFSVLLKMFGVIQIQHRNLCLSIKSVSPPQKKLF